jgi:hypothetical protein
MISKRLLIIVCAAALLPSFAEAGVRRFTFVYEATTGRPGSVDFENWITFDTHTPNAHDFREVAFRHELEIGLTEHLQASIYLADWQYQRGEGTDYSGSAVELLYNLTNPVVDPVGLAVYQEYKVGRRFFEWESKVIAQKNLGRFVAAYNATLEAEWEGHGLEERKGELQQSFGVSYEVNPHLAFGVECLHEIAFPEWDKAARGVFFAGPNASVRAGNLWATVTALAQLTDVGDEPDLQLRTIVGVMF